MFEQSGQQGEGGRGAQGLLVSKGFEGGNRGDTEERNYFYVTEGNIMYLTDGC